MKRFVFSLLALAALVAVPSCMKEPVASPDPALGGSPVEVSFQVDLNNVLTKADNNSALDDASGTWNLYVAAFSTADGSLISTSKIGGTGYDPVETLSGSTQKTVTLTLAKGASYKVVFFAEKAGAYNVSFADNKVAKFSYQSGLLANSAGLDAFFATVDVSSSTTVYSVTLKRPFAQVNVLVPLTSIPTGQTDFGSAMKVKAPTTFDLFAGAATGDASVVEFSYSGIVASPWGQYATTHKWVGMNYVLVPSDGMVEVTYFKESGMPVAIAPGKVPAKMNGRTNLVGNVYDMTTNFTFNVQIGPGFDSPDNEVPLTGEQTEITLADDKTYTEQNPLTIDASTAATPQNVTLRVNGHSFTEVLSGAAEDAKITAESADPKVATAAVNGNDVVITPVGNGQTTITITTPAYSKTDYRAGTFEIPVKVEGMAEQGGGGEGGEQPTGEKGSKTNPYTVAEALAATQALEPKGESATEVYVKGKVSTITSIDTEQYGSAEYFISDDGSTTGQFQMFHGKYLGGEKFTSADQLKVGDNVIVVGKLKNYANNDGTTTPEMQYPSIYSLNGQVADSSSGGDSGSGSGSGDQGGGSTVSGNTETFIFSAMGYANATDLTTITGQNVTLTFAKGTNTKNGPKYYDSGTNARLYGGNTLTFTSEKKITKIEFSFSPDYTDNNNNKVNSHATAECFSVGSFANDIWTGSENTVVLTNKKENNAQVRIVSLKITFE